MAKIYVGNRGSDILFISWNLARSGDWHDLFNFSFDQNEGFGYLGIVVFLSAGKQLQNMNSYFWKIDEMYFPRRDR